MKFLSKFMRKIIKIIISYILIIIYYILLIPFFKRHYINLKVAICTMGKKENLYVKEFIDYYIKLGVDHIFIYDDNDINSERISDVIDKSYKKYVTIYENKKKIIRNQRNAFTTCYNNNKKIFDWFLMIDIDEYLIIVKDRLKNYLSKNIFKKCDFIKIHWVKATDNNLLYYDKRPLLERFKGPYIKSHVIKTLVRGNIENLKYNIHSPYFSPKNNVTCNNIGERLNYKFLNFLNISKINIEKAYIIHFRFKSTEEFIKKYKRGYGNWVDSKFLSYLISEYFRINQITAKKIEYIEKELKINLLKYKIKIKKLKKK